MRTILLLLKLLVPVVMGVCSYVMITASLDSVGLMAGLYFAMGLYAGWVCLSDTIKIVQALTE